MSKKKEASKAIKRGSCIVYPTETVYGIGANALNENAVKNVFNAKDRDPSKPVSMAVPEVEVAERFISVSDYEVSFMKEFLPGPVTVVCEKKSSVPDVLTSGSDMVGIRIPDHQYTLDLLSHTGPITASSANISGTGSVKDVSNLSDDFLENISVVIDDGKLEGGTGSTVVNVSEKKIHRWGAIGQKVESWLQS